MMQPGISKKPFKNYRRASGRYVLFPRLTSSNPGRLIHRLNFEKWITIINTAKNIGINQVSFLPADVSSHAFNRQQTWDVSRQQEILPLESELNELQIIIDWITENYYTEWEQGFIAEPPGKLQQIHDYYAAFYNRNSFPYKKCNAPWVSTVVEADGTVRPCFFHEAMGNIQRQFA